MLTGQVVHKPSPASVLYVFGAHAVHTPASLVKPCRHAHCATPVSPVAAVNVCGHGHAVHAFAEPLLYWFAGQASIFPPDDVTA